MDLEGSAMTLNERKVVRRGLLAGLAALGAAAVMKLSGAEKAQAADGDFLKIGNTLGPTAGQDGSSETRLTTSPADGPAFQVNNNHAPVFNRSAITGAMSGTATSGVYGHNTSSDGYGVLGGNFTGIGVAGVGEPGVHGMAPLVGVQGYGTGGSGNGVRGAATNNGTGIRGVSNAGGSQAADGNGSGIGVLGKSTNGPGVQGNSINSLGVRGISTNFVGVVGISNTSHGLYGSTSISAQRLRPCGREPLGRRRGLLSAATCRSTAASRSSAPPRTRCSRCKTAPSRPSTARSRPSPTSRTSAVLSLWAASPTYRWSASSPPS